MPRRLSREELRDFLARHRVDLHGLSLGEFRAWLTARLDEAGRRESFRRAVAIRDIRRAHRRRLRDRERRLAAARAAFESSPAAVEHAAAENEAGDLRSAVAGLTQAVAAGRADPQKLNDFRKRLAAAEARLAEAERSPECRRVARAEASLARLRAEIGLDDAEAERAAADRGRGQTATRSGDTFESAASAAIRQSVLPDLAGRNPTVLHGVTLGCARGELDQVVVEAPADPDSPVAVRAVVEAKRNVNDLSHGFRLRQENLAWFAGDASGYEPDRYRTAAYPDGHFAGGATHAEGGREFRFTPASFAPFATPDAGPHRLAGLYFVTTERPLLGVSSAELGMLLDRVLSDPLFDPASDAKLRRFRTRALDLVADFQSEDVLALYAAEGAPEGHVLFA